MSELLPIAASQLKAARALLGWSQQQLAKNANVATSTIADFERGKRTPLPATLSTIQTLLENEGIAFSETGVTIGANDFNPEPVKIDTLPIRYFDATNLGQWSDRRDAQGQLPEAVNVLIRASAGRSAKLRIPSGDSVQRPGFDGACHVDDAFSHAYIPAGKSVWEMGTSIDVTKKANADFLTRAQSANRQTTFVFITSRRWNKKDEWIAAQKKKDIWADVRAYDADDLVHWAELYPAAGHRIAEMVGAKLSGLRGLADVWNEWSRSTKWPISEAMVLCGRDEQEARVWRWLNAGPAALTLRADSPIEAKAFLYAAIRSYPADRAEECLARTIVASSADAVRTLADSINPLTIVLDNIDPAAAAMLVEKGHQVLITDVSGISTPIDSDSLARPTREAMQEELVAMGADEKEARSWARESARSLVVLRRLIPAAPYALVPEWATNGNASLFMATMLAGGWSENSDADKKAMEILTGLPYAKLEEHLAGWLKKPDSPIRKVGPIWKIASPLDTWLRLAPMLSNDILERYKMVALSVIGEDNPLFDVPSDKRWVRGGLDCGLKHTEFLRSGLADTLILLAIFGTHATAVVNAPALAGVIVRKLLQDADARRWWSLYDQLRTLAEAAPQQFLDAVEYSLTQIAPPVLELFKEDDSPFGQIYHSHLLWALEILAWSLDYLAQCTLILIRLDQMAPKGRYQNRPGNSLRQIFLMWHPQTNANLTQRLDVLDALSKIEPDAVWSLMYSLLPQHHDIGHPSPLPRWREFSEGPREVVTEAVFSMGARGLFQRLIEKIGTNIGRWMTMLDALQRLTEDQRAEALRMLRHVVDDLKIQPERNDLWNSMRRLLHHHRAYGAGTWGLPAGDLAAIEEAYNTLAPDDEFDKVSWLFTGDGMQLVLPNPDGADIMQNFERSRVMRRDAVARIAESEGIDAALAFAEKVERPDLAADAVAALLDEASALVLLERVCSELQSGRMTRIAVQLMVKCGTKFEADWSEQLFEQPYIRALNTPTTVAILLQLPVTFPVRQHVARFGTDTEKLYWEQIDLYQVGAANDDLVAALDQLVAVGRARDAVVVASNYPAKVTSEMILRLLNAVPKEKESRPFNNTDAGMFTYALERLLIKLDGDPAITEDSIAKLEWTYLPLLEHSHSRRLRNLPKLISTDTAFFREIITAIYRPEGDDGTDQKEATAAEQQIASQAYTLLQSWKLLPGADGNTVDGKALQAWVNAARAICKESGHLSVADIHIGKMLAHSPKGADGVWPAEAVRDVVQVVRSAELDEGICTEIFNKVGVTTRGLNDGGAQERDRAKFYSDAAKATRLRWPRMSAVLARVAENFEEQAKIEDDRAERNNW